MFCQDSDTQIIVGNQHERDRTLGTEPPERDGRSCLTAGACGLPLTQREMVQAAFMQIPEFCLARGSCATRYHGGAVRHKRTVTVLILSTRRRVNTENTVRLAVHAAFAS